MKVVSTIVFLVICSQVLTTTAFVNSLSSILLQKLSGRKVQATTDVTTTTTAMPTEATTVAETSAAKIHTVTLGQKFCDIFCQRREDTHDYLINCIVPETFQYCYYCRFQMDCFKQSVVS